MSTGSIGAAAGLAGCPEISQDSGSGPTESSDGAGDDGSDDDEGSSDDDGGPTVSDTGRSDGGRPVYAVDPAPVIEGRDSEIRSAFLDMHYRRVESTVSGTGLSSHAVSYGHGAGEEAPEAPRTQSRLTAGVLTSPATVDDGENPLTTAPLSELLVAEEGTPLRRVIGLGSEVEWVRPPIEVDVRPTTTLGTETRVREFVGFVNNRSTESQSREAGATQPSGIGVVTVYALRVSVEGSVVVLGMADCWETQSLEPEDVDERNASRSEIVETATREVERSREAMDDSAGALTKTGDDEDEFHCHTPPDPTEEHELVEVGAAAGMTMIGQEKLGYRTEESGALDNRTSYLTGRSDLSDWDVCESVGEDFERGTEHKLEIETVTRAYTVGGDDTFPFGVVTAPLVERDGEEQNALATESLRTLLTTGWDGLLAGALRYLDLYGNSDPRGRKLSWETGPSELSTTLGAADFDSSLDDVTAFEGTVTQRFNQTGEDKAVDVHVVRKIASDRVWVALLVNVASGDEYWDSRSNAREVFTSAVDAVEFGTRTPGTWIDLGVEDLRLVQTVADTRVQNSSGSLVPLETSEVDDVDLVADENVAPLFDFDVPDPIPAHAVLEFDVDGLSALRRTTLAASSLEDLKDGMDTAVVFNRNSINGTNELPVFPIATDTGSVSMDARAPSGYTYSSETRDEGSDYTVAEVEPLRVGFIPITDEAPIRVRERYGGSNGRADSYDETVEMALSYLRRTYPGTVYAYQSPPSSPLPGQRAWLDVWLRSGKVMLDDFQAANNALQAVSGDVSSASGTVHALGGTQSDAESAIENNGFHATVAIVPSGYFEWYGNTFGYGNINGITPPLANMAVGVLEGMPETVAHELGHKFVADPYDVAGPNGDYPMAQRKTDLTAGSPTSVNTHHARHQDSDFRDNTPRDGPGVVSHGFDLTGGSFRIVEDYDLNAPSSSSPIFSYDNDGDDDFDLIESLMGYSGEAKWADERILQTLINNDWSRVGPGRWLFSATGAVDDDGAVAFTSVRALRNHPVVEEDEDGGAVSVEMVAPDEKTLATQQVGDSHRVHHVGEIDGFVSVDIPFPLESAELRATRNGTQTTLNPIVRPIRDAIDRVPDRGIEGDPETTREQVESDLDRVAAPMEAGDYETAASRLTAFPDTVSRKFLGEYGGYQNQPTSEELLDIVDRMIERLRVLAEYGGTSGPEPTTVSRERNYEVNDVSRVDVFTVSEQSEFSLAFENLTGCPFDVFVVALEQLSTYEEIMAGVSGPDTDKREEVQEFAREHAPADLRFFDAERGSGTTELSVGHYGIVFHRVCDIGTLTEIEYTATVGSGSFEEDDDSEVSDDTIVDEDGSVLELPSVAVQWEFTIPDPATISVEFENETGYPVDAYTMPSSEVENFLDDESGGFDYVEEVSFPAATRGSARADLESGEYVFIIENSADHGEAAPPEDADDPVFDVTIRYA